MTHIFIATNFAECLHFSIGCKYFAFSLMLHNIMTYCCNSYFPYIWNMSLYTQVFVLLYIYTCNSFAFPLPPLSSFVARHLEIQWQQQNLFQLRLYFKIAKERLLVVAVRQKFPHVICFLFLLSYCHPYIPVIYSCLSKSTNFPCCPSTPYFNGEGFSEMLPDTKRSQKFVLLHKQHLLMLLPLRTNMSVEKGKSV